MKELLEVPEYIIINPVVPLSEFLTSLVNDWDITDCDKFPIMGFINGIDFYNQPFQPEMLGKYFGIKFKTRGTRYDHYELEGIQTTHILLDKNFLTLSINYGAEYTFPLPKTLSDFIECCRMAGIELKWK